MRLFNGDCLNELQHLPDASIDLIIADPPYGITNCEWDKVIPFKRLWKELHRVAKDSAAIVIFGIEPFSSHLRVSNLDYYRYDLIYEKPSATGFLNANRQPMRAHENISVFYRKQPTYNPQKTSGHIRKVCSRNSANSNLYGKAEKAVKYDSTERYPRSVLVFSSDKQTNALHPTQKPIELLQYLIKTFSNPGDTVLDFTMGSGSTGAAALMLDRDFVGIEQDPRFFKTAEKWLNSICNFELV
ncbi:MULTISPECIES: site-specific DNA-methyltransferase [unclassified Snodgrassella]|uniref:DNA-methyltransferase n=1 Tax=unclassified Snodgrassella TaxID=2625236 RepID=UPI0018DB331A|nr:MULTISPECIES: site-specific DNA-methyltransferase [unclassified Snodgrassella]MBI0097267.1 site-specific DNA-methyltransferase [Snodgrassella sp. W8134]MBI0101000.1 site-specific DNA-methyltransferase [Snodgrassella sp. W8135]